MSRSAVYDALANDVELNGMGITEDTIFANFSFEERPTGPDPFLILKWESQALVNGIHRGPRTLTIWAHIPKESSTDFGDIDVILDRVSDVLVAMEHVTGGEGNVVTSVRAMGTGTDHVDPGYDTIARNAAFEVLSRKSAI